MKVGVLQQFLRSLVSPIEAAGAKTTAGELGATAAALDPFQSVDVTAFAAFLVRARDYEAHGTVPVPTPGQHQVQQLVRVLEQLQAATDGIPSLQQAAAATLQNIAAQAGLKGKLNADPKWAEARRLEARLAPRRKALVELAARVTTPGAYDDPAVRDGMAQLAHQLDTDLLKALAAEHGIKVTAKATAAKVISDAVAKLSGHPPPRAKPAPKSAHVDPILVEAEVRRLATIIKRSVDPDGVTESDVEDELARLKELSLPALFEVVSGVGIREARRGEPKSALLKRVRLELTAARRARERAEV
jgi:hypothetical protein